jgi:hypothetical protein
MSHHDPFEAWKRRRAGVPVPEDFVDSVLDAVHRRAHGRVRLRARAARLALGSLAAAVCLFRIFQVVAPFLVGHPSL